MSVVGFHRRSLYVSVASIMPLHSIGLPDSASLTRLGQDGAYVVLICTMQYPFGQHRGVRFALQARK